jgi:hypothetical protein
MARNIILSAVKIGRAMTPLRVVYEDGTEEEYELPYAASVILRFPNIRMTSMSTGWQELRLSDSERPAVRVELPERQPLPEPSARPVMKDLPITWADFFGKTAAEEGERLGGQPAHSPMVTLRVQDSDPKPEPEPKRRRPRMRRK